MIRSTAVAHHAARRPRSQSDSSMGASAGTADPAASRGSANVHTRSRNERASARTRSSQRKVRAGPAAMEEREAQRVGAAPRDQIAGIDRVAQPAAGDRRVLADDAVGERRGDRLGLVEEAEMAELVEQHREQPAVEHAVEVILAEDLPRDGEPAFELGVVERRAPRSAAEPPGRSSCHAASNRGSSVSVSRRARAAAGRALAGGEVGAAPRASRPPSGRRGAGREAGHAGTGDRPGTVPQRTTGTGAPHGPGREIGRSEAR